MNTRAGVLLTCLIAIFLLAADRQQAFPATTLPKSTLELLGKLNLSPGILTDIDKELQVPSDWIEKAKKEGKLSIRSSPTSSQVTTPPSASATLLSISRSRAATWKIGG